MMFSKIKSVILIVLSAFVCVTHSLNYDDLENTGISCPSRDSCYRSPTGGYRSPTGGYRSPTGGYRSKVSFMHRSCECDSACLSYKDCCINSYRRRNSRRKPAKSNMKCQQYGENPHTGVYLISDCSSDWKGPRQVREKCVGPPDFRDPLSAAPVTSVSQRQNITYRNLFCAECNNANMDSLTFFHIRMACEGLKDLSEEQILADLIYDEQLGSWGVNRPNSFGNSNNFVECKIIFDVPKYLDKKMRFCRSNIISKCATEWTSSRVKRSCEEYMAVVYDTKDTAFRNPHCAICNYRTVDELSCTSKVAGRKRPFSFVLLVDVNPRGGDEVGKETTAPQCPSGRIYDPFAKTCKLLLCALPGYKIVNGKCVRS